MFEVPQNATETSMGVCRATKVSLIADCVDTNFFSSSLVIFLTIPLLHLSSIFRYIFHVPVHIIFPEIRDSYAAKIKNPMDLTTAEAKVSMFSLSIGMSVRDET